MSPRPSNRGLWPISWKVLLCRLSSIWKMRCWTPAWVLDLLELKLRVVVSHLTQVLWCKPGQCCWSPSHLSNPQKSGFIVIINFVIEVAVKSSIHWLNCRLFNKSLLKLNFKNGCFVHGIKFSLHRFQADMQTCYKTLNSKVGIVVYNFNSIS